MNYTLVLIQHTQWCIAVNNKNNWNLINKNKKNLRIILIDVLLISTIADVG